MEFNINLRFNPIITITTEPIVIPATEPILLNFNSDVYADLNLMVFIKSNNQVFQYSTLPNLPIDITNLIKAGRLEINVKSLINGKPVKNWEISPIAVEEVTPDFKLYDLFQSLDARITALEKSHEIIL